MNSVLYLPRQGKHCFLQRKQCFLVEKALLSFFSPYGFHKLPKEIAAEGTLHYRAQQEAYQRAKT